MRAMYWTFSTSGLCSTSITKCEPAVSTMRGWRALRSSNSADAAPRTGLEPVTCTLTGCRALLAALTRRDSCAILGGTTYRFVGDAILPAQ